jgi:hypothetical protein
VCRVGGRWYEQRGYTPSTHIIKPSIPDLAQQVENEHFSLRLAEAAGLNVIRSEVVKIGDLQTILVARYDRVRLKGRQRLPLDAAGGKVFRMKVEFLGTNGTILTNTTSPTNWNQIRAVIVNLAAVDTKGLQLAGGSQEELAELLPGTATNPGDGILADWRKTLEDPGFLQGDARFPPETRRGIEVRRRIVPLAN